MSTIIEIKTNDDLPCNDWVNSKSEVHHCTMKEKWHEGEVRVCPDCGWLIGYNVSNEEYQKII